MPSPGTRDKSAMSKKMPVLIPSSQVTALVNGGRLNVMGSPVRRTELPLVHSTRLMRSTTDQTPGPAASWRAPAAALQRQRQTVRGETTLIGLAASDLSGCYQIESGSTHSEPNVQSRLPYSRRHNKRPSSFMKADGGSQ